MRVLKSHSSDLRDRLAVVNSFLEDSRRLIEAGKTRRWEVFKWAITLQIVIISLALTSARTGLSHRLPVVLSALVTLVGVGLIGHYSKRMRGARSRAIECIKWLRSHVLDINDVTGQKEDEDHRWQDDVELLAFSGILGLATGLTILGFSKLNF